MSHMTETSTNRDTQGTLTPRSRKMAFTNFMKSLSNLADQHRATVSALKSPKAVAKKIFVTSPRSIARDENAGPEVPAETERQKLTIRLPRRRQSLLKTPTSKAGTSKPQLDKAPGASDPETLVSSSPEPLAKPPTTTQKEVVRERSSSYFSLRQERINLLVDKRVEEKLGQWEKNMDVQLEWIEKKCENKIDERTQQLRQLLDEQERECVWAHLRLNDTLLENERLLNTLAETQEQVRDLQRQLRSATQEPQDGKYRRAKDPQRTPFYKWRRDPATEANRPRPINTKIASEFGKQTNLPLLTQSESPGLVDNKKTTRVAPVATAIVAEDAETSRRGRKRQREEGDAPQHETNLVDKGKGRLDGPDPLRRTRGRKSLELRSPPNKRTKVEEFSLYDFVYPEPEKEVGQWVDVDLPEDFHKDPMSIHLMMLSPKSRKEAAKNIRRGG